MEGKIFSAVSEEELAREQRAFDVDKWLSSERAGFDLCGTLPRCGYCIKGELYPCAKARYRQKLAETLQDIVQEEGKREEADALAAAEEIAVTREDAPEVMEKIAVEEIAEEDVAKATEAVPAGYERVVRLRRSFRSRIIQSTDLQDVYTELKNVLLGYAGVKARICQGSENFRVGKKKIAKLSVSGKALSVFLALDPFLCEEENYRFEDVSDKKSHRETPVRIRLTSRRALKQAKELISVLADGEGLAQVGCIYTDFHYPYRSDEYLIKKGLIRPYTVLVRKKI